MDKKIFLITRIKKLEKPKEIECFKKWLEVFSNSGQISKIFVISDVKYWIDPTNRVKFILDKDPTSPTSMNLAIRDEEFIRGNPKSFIIASREVKVAVENIKKLISELKKNDNILCVGYKFEIIGVNGRFNFNKELENYYSKKSLAYQVPWNTCIIWNYSLFKKYIVEFDEICNKNPFAKLNVCVDGVAEETKYQGMEDGLAIAKAVSNKKAEIKFKLLNKEKRLEWNLKGRDMSKHRIKLARKNEVLLKFMAVRDYFVDDLLKAKEN